MLVSMQYQNRKKFPATAALRAATHGNIRRGNLSRFLLPRLARTRTTCAHFWRKKGTASKKMAEHVRARSFSSYFSLVIRLGCIRVRSSFFSFATIEIGCLRSED